MGGMEYLTCLGPESFFKVLEKSDPMWNVVNGLKRKGNKGGRNKGSYGKIDGRDI